MALGHPLGSPSFSSVTVSPSNGTTSTRTTVTPSASSQTLIAANTARKGLRIAITTSDPSQNFWISTGTASSTNFFTSARGSSIVELYDETSWKYTGVWNVISDATTGAIQVWELTA